MVHRMWPVVPFREAEARRRGEGHFSAAPAPQRGLPMRWPIMSGSGSERSRLRLELWEENGESIHHPWVS